MKKVLIIEDDKGIAELERDYLEANGFEVQMAFTGLSGKKAALSSPVDLILLDIMLPGEDGFQVCREIRAEKDIPILMVSARQEDIDKIRGLGLGADDYIVKPFSPTELVARVKSHISRYEQLTNRESSRPQVLRCGNLVIDLSSHQVFLQDKEILLPNKEFELLAFLAKNPGIVFSKDTLFERVWGEDSLGDTSTVSVHINRIREKIEEDSSKLKRFGVPVTVFAGNDKEPLRTPLRRGSLSLEKENVERGFTHAVHKREDNRGGPSTLVISIHGIKGSRGSFDGHTLP